MTVVSIVEDPVDGVFKIVFTVIFLALVIVWIWNPIAARLSLPSVDVVPYLLELLFVGIVLYLARSVYETYR